MRRCLNPDRVRLALATLLSVSSTLGAPRALAAGIFDVPDANTKVNTPDTSATTAPARLPVPPAAAVAKAQANLRQLYAADYARHAASDRDALAHKLLSIADAPNAPPADRYACLREATDLAGSPAVAIQAGQALNSTFDVDGSALEAETLCRLAARASADETRAMVDAGPELAKSLIDQGDFALAGRVATAISAAASRNGLEKAMQTRAWATDVQGAATQGQSAAVAIKKLKTFPDDPQANGSAGRFYCFTQGDWNKGLPLLAKGDDPALATLAKQDMGVAGDNAKPDDIAASAGAWYDASLKQAAAVRRSMRQRARLQYERALPNLEGLSKTSAEKRLTDLADTPDTSHHASVDGRTLNLLALLDRRELANSKWVMRERQLVSPDGQVDRLVIPYQPPTEYDVTMVFSRLLGNDDIIVGLTHGDTNFAFSCGAGGSKAVIGRLKGEWANSPSAGTVTIEKGKTYTAVIKVRDTGVQAFVDGALIVEYKGDYSDLTKLDLVAPPDGKCLALVGWKTSIGIKALSVTEIKDQGTLVNPLDASGAIKANDKGVFDLKAIDATLHGKSFAYNADRHAIGKWTDRNEYVTWDIDVEKPGEYEVAVSYSAGDKFTNTTLGIGLTRGDRVTKALPFTNSWDRFEDLDMGKLYLPAGHSTLSAAIASSNGMYLLDLRNVKLTPAAKP